MENITDFIGGGWRNEMGSVERVKKGLDRLERIAGDWNGEDERFVSGGDVYSAEDAEVAAEKVEEIKKILNLQ